MYLCLMRCLKCTFKQTHFHTQTTPAKLIYSHIRTHIKRSELKALSLITCCYHVKRARHPLSSYSVGCDAQQRSVIQFRHWRVRYHGQCACVGGWVGGLRWYESNEIEI